jgi:hypothetical protein
MRNDEVNEMRGDVMTRFTAFEDSALEARLERLRRSEVDLQDRVHARIAQAEREGRWVPSDPLYQRLSSLLKQVRDHLDETEQEHQRRVDQRAQRATQANGSEHRVKALAPAPRVPSRRTVAKGPKQPAASQAAAYSGS